MTRRPPLAFHGAHVPPSPRRRRAFFLCVVLLLFALVAARIFLLPSPQSLALGKIVASWEGAARAGQTFEAEATVAAVEGLPDEILGRTVRLLWQPPDKLRLETRIDDEDIVAGRDGKTLWVHLPGKPFTLVGDETVPRFTADPASVESVDLPELRFPLGPLQTRLVPFLVRGQTRPDRWTEWTLSPLGSLLVDAPDASLASRAGDDGSTELRLHLPDGKKLELHVARFATDHAATPADWTPPAEAADRADHVALSHLTRCLRVVLAQVGARTPTLPPATGRRELVATSGKGRLERHDGVRVLFLQGSPAEMGRQQGELLRDEVRSVVDRILYGVGVGSSFSKGRWFFGEIEEAQSRIEPFIPATHLGEMDAIAEAAGLHRQESRLANFFPELFHCSGFALHGAATEGGRLYHGRILDYIRGAGLEDNAVVTVSRPDGANAWVNVTYAGFIGSVTAMNEKQVAIGEMGGRGEGHWDGKPMAQLVREVMETCDTLDEAVALMREGPRTCEYYYVLSDGKTGQSVGIKATPELFETVSPGQSHPQLPDPVADTVLLSAGDRYTELVRRVKEGYGYFDAESARELMTHPVCMKSNIQSVLFAPGSLEFWVANADSDNVASHTRYTRFHLGELLGEGGETRQ